VDVSPASAGESAAAAAASSIARRVGLNNRASAADMGTSAAAARTAGSRASQTRWPPNWVAAASSGTSGGWSTYPKAG
jgi:hypothetical protein